MPSYDIDYGRSILHFFPFEHEISGKLNKSRGIWFKKNREEIGMKRS